MNAHIERAATARDEARDRLRERIRIVDQRKADLRDAEADMQAAVTELSAREAAVRAEEMKAARRNEPALAVA